MQYDFNFYKNRDESTRYSATTVLSLLTRAMPALRSAVDVGCGVGTWLAVLRSRGIKDILGIDGPWVQDSLLQIPVECFRRHDLSTPLNISRRFDLAISLEVAEHLPESAAESFVAGLAGLADTVLFSAAIPGQGGTNHVNEQWQDYWVERFCASGYAVHDIVRPHIWSDPRIPFWYRQNTLVFAKADIRFRDVPGLEAPAGGQISIVHPEQFVAKNMDRLGVRECSALTLRAVRRYFSARHAIQTRAPQAASDTRDPS